MKKLIISIASLFFLSMTPNINAGGLALEAGLHFGGDDLATAQFVGGGSETIKAGELISGSIGYTTSISDGVELRTLFGIKIDLISAENGDVTFNRFPLDIMVFNKGESVSAGIGITYHLSPELELSGAAGNGTLSFDDALGFLAEIDFNLSEKAYLGLKFTAVDYEVNNAFASGEVSGNSVGIVIGVTF